jgi:twitching motility protein PilT
VAKLDALFDEMVNRGGSDLHVAVGAPPLGRVRGELVEVDGGPLDAAAVEERLLELLSPAQRSRLEQDMQLEFAYAHKDTARFRASYFRKATGLGAVFRVVPARAPSLAELGCPEVLWRLADRAAGLVLVVGPARSGKSTTMAAMLDHINKTRGCHVLSIEDSIELVHESNRAQITQREVGAHVPSVEVALRNAPRENPDVVFVNELRTAEAARLAMRLASSGVAVFATVAARGVVAGIDRLVRASRPERQQQTRGLLADSLCGAVGQVLVPSPDPKGRAAVHEVLVASPEVAAAVRDADSAALVRLMKAGEARGMLTLDVALERLVGAGRLTFAEALEHAHDKEAFANAAGK